MENVHASLSVMSWNLKQFAVQACASWCLLPRLWSRLVHHWLPWCPHYPPPWAFVQPFRGVPWLSAGSPLEQHPGSVLPETARVRQPRASPGCGRPLRGSLPGALGVAASTMQTSSGVREPEYSSYTLLGTGRADAAISALLIRLRVRSCFDQKFVMMDGLNDHHPIITS